ncbi:hypothetical protein EGI15_19725 [Chryseobacterium cucumeris]|uniref:Polyketide cyclase / dehydrase and lipid transport n=1 Tax=Chryseobacterium cucumeris TaxID=1813611 RepID=A0ABX9X194_9FLAO|nr:MULTISPECIES: hypothetical protein [Chryseobacterium]KYH06893.1 hypothetical protein A1704_22140 [Chryseobacterium cucumeris]QWT86183.1 hypothetical protein KBP46_22630 [Chryseobacterium sp. PCH239]ROH88911.1 hypothetical protein EGI15_19725 [Chryseobacterium cucumeris]
MKNFFKRYLYLSLFLTVVLIVAVWFFLVAKGEYGVTLFFTIPVSIGFIIGYVKYFKNIGLINVLKTILKIVLGLVIFSLILIGAGVEGAICIIMAIPFIGFAMFVGFNIGFIIGVFDEKRHTGSVIVFILFINPASYIFDTYTKPIEETITTEMIVNSSNEKVWKLLNTQINFNTPDFILFEKGVSYPKNIKLVNENGKLGYSCQTNNDDLHLSINEFIENKKVKFSLENQTVPMKEVTPYKDIDAKHLHDYFIVKYGEITLEKLSENRTKIIAKTKYSYKIAPTWYWKKWSGYIIDKMQSHVLQSIKKQSENE